jgi:hypothetical protein
MIIRHLPAWDKSMNSNERHELKKLIVAEWAGEYRWTTVGVLAERLGVSVKSSARFWRQMFAEGILVKVKNPNYQGKDPMVRLGPQGFLLCEGLNKTSVLRSDRAARAEQINHHLGIQKALIRLGFVSRAHKITFSVHEPPAHLKKKRAKTENDVRFRPQDESIIPDSVMESLESGKEAALEFENTKKANKRYIYWIFRQYAQLISEKKLSAVYFAFSDAKVKAHYEELWNAEIWPKVTRNAVKRGYYYEVSDTARYTLPKQLRKNFAFLTLPRAGEKTEETEELEETGEPEETGETEEREETEEIEERGYYDDD